MHEKEKQIIKIAISNAINFLLPPISKAQEDIAEYEYEWTDEHYDYAIKCLDDFLD